MICPKCGEELSECNLTCPNCGFGIREYLEEEKLEETRKIVLALQEMQQQEEADQQVEKERIQEEESGQNREEIVEKMAAQLKKLEKTQRLYTVSLFECCVMIFLIFGLARIFLKIPNVIIILLIVIVFSAAIFSLVGALLSFSESDKIEAEFLNGEENTKRSEDIDTK